MICLLLSPVLQFGNSGGPLVNLVSSPACSLAVGGRGVPCALWSVPPGAQCPWVGALTGATAAGRKGLCMHQAPCEEEQGTSPVEEPCAAPVLGSLSRWDSSMAEPSPTLLMLAGQRERLRGLRPVGPVPAQPRQDRAGCGSSRLGRDGRTGGTAGLAGVPLCTAMQAG